MKKRSRLLTEVHETAEELHRSGAIDKQTMRDFDALCLPAVPSMLAYQAEPPDRPLHQPDQ